MIYVMTSDINQLLRVRVRVSVSVRVRVRRAVLLENAACWKGVGGSGVQPYVLEGSEAF